MVKKGAHSQTLLESPGIPTQREGAACAHPDSTWVNIEGDLRAAPSAFILVVLASLLILPWEDPEGSWKRQWTLTDSVVVERMGCLHWKASANCKSISCSVNCV